MVWEMTDMERMEWIRKNPIYGMVISLHKDEEKKPIQESLENE